MMLPVLSSRGRRSVNTCSVRKESHPYPPLREPAVVDGESRLPLESPRKMYL